jgi:hypothetical protein
MAITFPTTLDSLTNPSASDPMTSPSHATQHANANDAIEALEAKVGINSSTVKTSFDYRLTSLGYNVMNYGAVGDGSNDDTSAIQAAIDATPARGGIVFLPVGQYKISSSLSIIKPITLVGAGYSWNGNNAENATYLPATELLWYGSSNTGPMVIVDYAADANPVAGVQLESFTCNMRELGQRRHRTRGHPAVDAS